MKRRSTARREGKTRTDAPRSQSSANSVERGASLGKASAIVLIGNIGGFIVLIVTTPIVSRMYSPDLYGEYATIIAVGSIFVGVSTLRLEILAQGTKNKQESDRLLGNGMTISLGVASFFSAASGAVWFFFEVPLAWVCLGLIVLLSSWQLLGAALLTRDRRYREFAAGSFFQQGGTGVLQAAFGAVGGGMVGLISGFCIPRLVWLIPMSRQLVTRGLGQLQPRAETIRRGTAAGSSAFVNSLAGQLIILVPGLAYGSVYAGLTAMATRLLVSPLSLISRSVASAAVGEVGRLLREERSRQAEGVVRKNAALLLALGGVPCLPVLIFGPVAFSLVLGDEWSAAGSIASAMALGAWAQFAIVPFSQILNLSGSSDLLLRWDLLRLVLLSASLSLPILPRVEPQIGIWAYSLSQVILYAVLYRMIMSALKRDVGQEDSTEVRT